MKIHHVVFYLTGFLFSLQAHAENIDSVLHVLDEYLNHKEHYVNLYRQKMKEAEDEAKRITAEGTPQETMKAWNQVLGLAFSRDGNLALKACNFAVKAADQADDKHAKIYFLERKALVYGMCGLPWEGKILLDSLLTSIPSNHDLSGSLYTSYYDLYDFFHAYDLPEDIRNRNYAFLKILEDTIKNHMTDPAELAMTFHYSSYDENAMIASLKEQLDKVSEDQKGVILTTISNKYFLKRDIPHRDYYWALAAICNTRTARRDNEALTRLAARLYECGDTQRAIRYTRSAYDDALAYPSKTRALEIAPLLNNSIATLSHDIENTKRQLSFWQTISLILLLTAGGLCVLCIRLYRQKKRYSMQQKDERNKMQYEVDTLRSDAELKNEYISRYLNLSLDETFRIEQLKSTVMQRLQAGEIERLRRMMKDPSFPDNFRQQSLHRFDIAFLRLYPNFTKEVNKILPQEERIELPDNEVLNNDIRILAFMRLGITDSQKIATILGVAINTVYFYRNKLRRKALRRESFENDIMKIEGDYRPITD